MTSIRIHLGDPTDSKRITAEVADDIPMQKLIPAIVNRIGLPIIGPNGKTIKYNFIRRSTATYMDDEATMQSAGIAPDEIFNIIPAPENEPSKKTTDSIVKILFLASNPKNTSRLRLDEEIRSIDLSLRHSNFANKFDIRQHWAVRVMDLQEYLLRNRPNIVHFSGHGNSVSELIMEDMNGNSITIPTESLSQLFEVLKDNIRCVILNLCYSEKQAQAIANHIDCVIGMTSAIGDLAAINFSAAFYQAIGYGRDVETAFKLGCLQVDMQRLSEPDIPKLISRKCNPREIFFVKG